MLNLLGSVALSATDKAVVIGMLLLGLAFLIGYAVGCAKGARRQRERDARPVLTLFNPSNQPDKY